MNKNEFKKMLMDHVNIITEHCHDSTVGDYIEISLVWHDEDGLKWDLETITTDILYLS